jgi:hypothetical protein
MKTLVFADASTISVNDESSISCIICTVSSFNDIQALYTKFTEENMKRVTLDGASYTGIIPTGATASANSNGTVNATFTSRTMSAEENTANQITELQEAVAELVGGAN